MQKRRRASCQVQRARGADGYVTWGYAWVIGASLRHERLAVEKSPHQLPVGLYCLLLTNSIGGPSPNCKKVRKSESQKVRKSESQKVRKSVLAIRQSRPSSARSQDEKLLALGADLRSVLDFMARSLRGPRGPRRPRRLGSVFGAPDLHLNV